MIKEPFLTTEMMSQMQEHLIANNGFLHIPNAFEITKEFICDQKFEQILKGKYLFAPLLDAEILSEVKQITAGITQKSLSLQSAQILSFKHTDFLLTTKCEEEYIVIIDITKKWIDSYGGVPTITDGEGNALTIPFSKGGVSIVTCKDRQFFISYCNNNSEENERKVLLLKYNIENQE